MIHREMRFHYHFFHVIVRPLFKSLFKFQVFGSKNVPSTSGALLVSNHVSYVDPVFLGAAVDRNLNYMARSTLFRKHRASLTAKQFKEKPRGITDTRNNPAATVSTVKSTSALSRRRPTAPTLLKALSWVAPSPRVISPAWKRASTRALKQAC